MLCLALSSNPKQLLFPLRKPQRKIIPSHAWSNIWFHQKVDDTEMMHQISLTLSCHNRLSENIYKWAMGIQMNVVRIVIVSCNYERFIWMMTSEDFMEMIKSWKHLIALHKFHGFVESCIYTIVDCSDSCCNYVLYPMLLDLL